MRAPSLKPTAESRAQAALARAHGLAANRKCATAAEVLGLDPKPKLNNSKNRTGKNAGGSLPLSAVSEFRLEKGKS